MANIDEIVNYYSNLLIVQYHNRPKAKAHIELLVRELLAEGVILDVQNGYNLDTAIGKQLDILGKYIGVDRFYNGDEFTANYFGFADATSVGGVSANIVGFDDAASPSKTGLFLDASSIVANNVELTDDSYRTLLKLKIAQNNSNHSTASITDSVAKFFGNSIIMKDNYDMTITYLIGDYSATLIRAVISKKVLPKPMGVGMQVINGQNWFGFADATKLNAIPTYLSGFNDAAVGFTQTGGFLNASIDLIY